MNNVAEVPHLPRKDEIIARAIALFQQDMIARGLTPITPTEAELKEGNWFEKARIDLMSGVKSQLEGYLSYLESEVEGIREQLGITPAPPPPTVRELEEDLDILTARHQETKKRLREAKKEIELLRAVKVPPKVVEAPPPPPEKPLCPAHKVELLPVVGVHHFPWGTLGTIRKIDEESIVMGGVPGEMFLYQCPEEREYYICEPRKRCELVSLDKLRRKLAAIIKPIEVRVPRERIVEPAELATDFDAFLADAGITREDYNRLDRLGKFVMRSEFRRWKARPY